MELICWVIIWFFSDYLIPWENLATEIALGTYAFFALGYLLCLYLRFRKEKNTGENSPKIAWSIYALSGLMLSMYPYELPPVFGIVLYGCLVLIGIALLIWEKLCKNKKS